MKIKVLCVVFLSFFVLSAASKVSAQTGAPASVTSNDALYKSFYAGYRGTVEEQKAAYETGKAFLTKYSAVNDDYTRFVKKWVAKYEKATLEYNFQKSFEDKKYADAITASKSLPPNRNVSTC